MGPLKALNDTKLVLDEHAVMLLVGGQGGLKGFSPPGIWGLQLTLIKSDGGSDYTHRITASSPGIGNLSASLSMSLFSWYHSEPLKVRSSYSLAVVHSNPSWWA